MRSVGTCILVGCRFRTQARLGRGILRAWSGCKSCRTRLTADGRVSWTIAISLHLLLTDHQYTTPQPNSHFNTAQNYTCPDYTSIPLHWQSRLRTFPHTVHHFHTCIRVRLVYLLHTCHRRQVGRFCLGRSRGKLGLWGRCSGRGGCRCWGVLERRWRARGRAILIGNRAGCDRGILCLGSLAVMRTSWRILSMAFHLQFQKWVLR